MGYRTRRKSHGYSVANGKTHKEKAAEKFESYIKLPASKIDVAISKEQTLLAVLESSLRKFEVFRIEVFRLLKATGEATQLKIRIDSLIRHRRIEQEKYDAYHRAGVLGRLFKSKPMGRDDYYEEMFRELKEKELESNDLADRLAHLKIDLTNKQTTIEEDVITNENHHKKQSSLNTRKHNAELRLAALLQAKSHVRVKEESIQEREQAAAKEVSKYKAYAAAYFDESRKLAQSVKNEMHGQERIVNGCPYCGSQLDEIPHADHIYPIVKGGLSVKENMVYVCCNCNLRKSGMTLREFITKAGLDRSFVEANLENLGKTF